MNLPRHTLTSHALLPTFVNAQFHITKEKTSRSSSQQQQQQQRRGDTQSNSVRLDNGESSSTGHRHPVKEEEKQQSNAVDDVVPTSSSMFACATRQGYFIALTHPLEIVARRDFPASQGGLAHISLVDDSSLLVLVGGGRVPRFAPNKVILWDEDASRIVALKQPGTDTPSSSEGSASPVASTLFSLGQEREEGDMSNSRGTMSQSSASRGKTQDSTQSAGGERNDEEMSVAPDIADGDDTATLKTMEDANTSASAHMSSSAYVEDPFGAPIMEAKTQQQSPPSPPASKASKARSSYQSTGLPSVSHAIRKGREVAELEFGEAVKGVCVKTFDSATLLVVTLNSKAVVFEMGAHLSPEQEEINNAGHIDKPRWGIRQRLAVEIRPGLEKGLAVMASIPNSNCILLALPGRQTGHVQLLSIALSKTSRTSIRSSIAGASTIIAAHANAISSLTLSEDGRLLCTTSERGTLLRIWSTLSTSSQERNIKGLSTTLIGELRRGSDAAKIWSVAFSPDSLLLAAGSDKGTIHFFDLQPLHQVMSPSRPPTPTNANMSSNNLSKKANKYLPPSVQQFTGSIPPSLLPQYLKSQWGFTQFKVPLKVFSSSVAEGSRSSPIPLYRRRRQQEYEGGGEESDVQHSTEGAWASMRGRIDDVRKGEKGIEEAIWLTWIPASPSSVEVKRQSDQTSMFELIAITSSGSHYRIGVAIPERGQAKAVKKSATTTVLDMYKEDSSSQKSTLNEKDNNTEDKENQRQQCWLLEYQRFGMRDEWVD